MCAAGGAAAAPDSRWRPINLTTVAELGDLTRFGSPRQVMNYLGLTPSEYSRGERRRQGGITKMGNGHARRVLVEAAKAYRHRAKVSEQIQARQQQLPKEICDIAWRAQVRLCGRYKKLAPRGEHANTIAAAVARELAGFMWAIVALIRLPPHGGRNEGRSFRMVGSRSVWKYVGIGVATFFVLVSFWTGVVPGLYSIAILVLVGLAWRHWKNMGRERR